MNLNDSIKTCGFGGTFMNDRDFVYDECPKCGKGILYVIDPGVQNEVFCPCGAVLGVSKSE